VIRADKGGQDDLERRTRSVRGNKEGTSREVRAWASGRNDPSQGVDKAERRISEKRSRPVKRDEGQSVTMESFSSSRPGAMINARCALREHVTTEMDLVTAGNTGTLKRVRGAGSGQGPDRISQACQKV